mmetsp:Transcript_27217/g.24106  ORF Transcript_27217/g.24106 Transcript_27217/m.24106 type:complete len:108 (-) Transcript_27217:196-519(-)
MAIENFVSKKSSKIFASRILNPIVEKIKKIAGNDYNKTMISNFENSTFIAFSSHDFQLTHILILLDPLDFDLSLIEFASSFIIEVHTSKTEYFIKIFFNDDPLHLPG